MKKKAPATIYCKHGEVESECADCAVIEATSELNRRIAELEEECYMWEDACIAWEAKWLSESEPARRALAEQVREACADMLSNTLASQLVQTGSYFAEAVRSVNLDPILKGKK